MCYEWRSQGIDLDEVLQLFIVLNALDLLYRLAVLLGFGLLQLALLLYYALGLLLALGYVLGVASLLFQHRFILYLCVFLAFGKGARTQIFFAPGGRNFSFFCSCLFWEFYIGRSQLRMIKIFLFLFRLGKGLVLGSSLTNRLLSAGVCTLGIGCGLGEDGLRLLLRELLLSWLLGLGGLVISGQSRRVNFDLIFLSNGTSTTHPAILQIYLYLLIQNCQTQQNPIQYFQSSLPPSSKFYSIFKVPFRFNLMKESKTIDQIKLKVDLIGKIKKKESININNILLNTEVNNIADKQIKLMLEIESLNSIDPGEKYIEELAFNIEEEKMGCRSDSVEEKVYSLMALKLRAIQLVKAIRGKKSNISDLVEKILTRIQKLEELTYIFNVLFQIQSIVALEKIDYAKLIQKYRSHKHLKSVLHIVMLVKAISSWNEVAKLGNREQAEKFMKENAQIINVLTAFKVKQLQLTKKKQNNSSISDKQFHNLSNISKTKIKNYFQTKYRIAINDSNPEQTFVKLNSSMTEERIYLQAFPIAHLYFQKNLDVIQSLNNAEYIKYLCTSQSILVERYQQLSANKSWSKSKMKPDKNPQNYKNYLGDSEQFAKKICVPACKEGMIVTKHNYGNSSSSIKFIIATDKTFQYYKTSSMQSGSKWKFAEILGVVYGKASPRMFESNQIASNCFSIILCDRTLDFSVENVIEQPNIFRFMIGLNLLIRQYQQQQKQLQMSKKNQQPEKVKYHQGKMQTITRGKLLWSSLIIDLYSKNKSSFEGSQQRYLKMQGFKSNPKNRSSSQVSKP